MKLAILIPTRGLLFTQTVEAILRELQTFKGEYRFFFTINEKIPDCRNNLTQQGLDWGADHLLLLDDDVIIPEGGLQAMLKLKTPVTLIDYPTHWIGSHAGNTGNAAYDNWLGGPTDGLPLVWAGLGCVLVERGVFEKLGYPYFKKGGYLFERDKKNGKISYTGLAGGDGGEDVEFYFALTNKGIPFARVEAMTAGHAKVMKFVGVLQSGKYVTQHDIVVNDTIDRPIK